MASAKQIRHDDLRSYYLSVICCSGVTNLFVQSIDQRPLSTSFLEKDAVYRPRSLQNSLLRVCGLIARTREKLECLRSWLYFLLFSLFCSLMITFLQFYQSLSHLLNNRYSKEQRSTDYLENSIGFMLRLNLPCAKFYARLAGPSITTGS